MPGLIAPDLSADDKDEVGRRRPVVHLGLMATSLLQSSKLEYPRNLLFESPPILLAKVSARNLFSLRSVEASLCKAGRVVLFVRTIDKGGRAEKHFDPRLKLDTDVEKDGLCFELRL